jgi:hypothetical protein
VWVLVGLIVGNRAYFVGFACGNTEGVKILFSK